MGIFHVRAGAAGLKEAQGMLGMSESRQERVWSQTSQRYPVKEQERGNTHKFKLKKFLLSTRKKTFTVRVIKQVAWSLGIFILETIRIGKRNLF